MKSSFSKRGSVGVLKRLNYSQAEVAKTLRVTKGFVKYWWNRSNMEDKSKSGRRRKTTKSVSNQIVKRLKMNLRQSTRKIGRELHLSHTTVANVARRNNLFPYHPTKKLLMSEKHQANRLSFAKSHQHFNWRRAIFTDEKIAWLVPKPNSKNDVIWAEKGTKVLPSRVDRHSAKLNVSAAISFDHKSSIFIFKTNLDSPLYTKIVKSTIIPLSKKMEFADSVVIMDGDPKHCSKMTKEFLADKSVSTMILPAKSPDLNLIENVWSELTDNINSIGPKTQDQFAKAIKKAWDQVPQEHIRNCFKSMPARIQAVIDNGGAPTKY